MHACARVHAALAKILQECTAAAAAAACTTEVLYFLSSLAPAMLWIFPLHRATDHPHPPPSTHSPKPCMLQQLSTPCLTHSGTVCPSALPLLLLSLTPPSPGVAVPTHTLGQFSHHTTLLLLLLLPGTCT